MDENRGRFLKVCFGTRHDDQAPVLNQEEKMPVPKLSDLQRQVRVLRDKGRWVIRMVEERMIVLA